MTAGTSYRIVVPPGWILLPVRDRSDDELRAAILERYRDLPRDSAGPLIARLADAVIDAARRARDAGAVDIVMPLGTPWRVPVSASIALAIGTDATTPSGAVVETEAGPAWRDTPPSDSEATRRRIGYTWRIPDTVDGLLFATASVVGGDDPELAPVVDALADLCEAILATVRWTKGE